MRIPGWFVAFATLSGPLAAQRGGTFACIPDSTFRLGVVAVGDSVAKALSALGTPDSTHDRVEHGMDQDFPLTVYSFKDLEVTVSKTTELVAAIRPLSRLLQTPLGLRLGMPRGAAEHLFPLGALKPKTSGTKPDTTAREIFSCGGKGSTIVVEFDGKSRVSRFVLYGFWGKSD